MAPTSPSLRDTLLGPRELDHHSKWPMPLRLHGSIIPVMILPLLFVGAWATAVTCISKFEQNLGISELLLTVLGFVVGLALSFRSSTAYERYNEGRKYWSQLACASQNLARLIWVHADEQHDLDAAVSKRNLLDKITCLNLIPAFAIALKHRLRYEPYTHYDDLKHLIPHIDTYARAADRPEIFPPPSAFESIGVFLGLPWAETNPRKECKHSPVPLGNLPLEILIHIESFLKKVFDIHTFEMSSFQSQAFNNLAAMDDALTGTYRILETPLPLAYSIAFAQITWVYILLLPFQLYNYLGWVTIPACVFAAYIILGIALIGREIENPFGNDTNDLPMDMFCEQIRRDVTLIMSKPHPPLDSFVLSRHNEMMYPVSQLGGHTWSEMDIAGIRTALNARPKMLYPRTEDEEKEKIKESHGECLA